MPWTDKEMSIFLPYFYRKVRKSNPELYKVLNDSQLLEKYNTDPKFKNLADSQLLARIEIFAKEQGRKGEKGGTISAYNKLQRGFFQSREWKESQSKGGITSGNNNVKSGHIDDIRPLANAISHSKIECIHCKEPGDYVNIERYHNDNCDYPKFKHFIEQCKPTDDEFKIKPFVDAIFKLSGVKKTRIDAVLKRRYVVPSGKHNIWKWDPLTEDEDSRLDSGVMYKKLPYTDKNRRDKLAKMLYDLILFDGDFKIKELPDLQAQCEYRLNIRDLLMHSPKYFKVRKQGAYVFKKLTK